jgi:NAD(P)H-hydrate epimerase
MHLVTAEEMREMDRQTIETFGLPGRVLMENAGRGACRILMRTFPDISSGRVAVIAGRGNNGGDGFVIARYLSHANIPVTVYLLTESHRLSGNAAENFNLLESCGVAVQEITDENRFRELKTQMAHHDFFVDAMLGTGLNSDVRGLFRIIIDTINGLSRDMGRPVFSVDIPSGLHANTGRPCGACIRATATATFAFPKVGLVLLPGAECVGDLSVVDIGIPPHIVKNVPPRHHLLTESRIKSLIRPRPAELHKGGTGHVLVVAGASGKTGAAALCSVSAMRTGAGLVTLGIPKTLHPVLESLALEVMTEPLPETATAAHTEDALDDILGMLKDKKCLALGPGMGTNKKTAALVRQLVEKCPVPMVLDADGLNNLAGHTDILKHRQADILLTPHPGEMARLIGATPKIIQENRLDTAKKFAVDHGVTVILKGARTVIAHPDGHIDVNPTGNPGMASGGMGDILTGMVAGFLAQGYPPAAAACLGAFLHGQAADRVSEVKGPYGYLASDVMDTLPEIIRILTGQTAYQSAPVFRPVQTELL